MISLAHLESKSIKGDELTVIMTAAVQSALTLLAQDNDVDSYYFIPKNIIEGTVVLALLRGCDSKVTCFEDRDIREKLSALLCEIAKPSISDKRILWIRSLFEQAKSIRAGNLAGQEILGNTLWQYLTGVKDVAIPRSDLLVLLYKMGFIDDVLGPLAKNYAKPFDFHIIRFLHAVNAANANIEAWDESRRLAQAFHEQAEKGTSIRPWRRLIEQLNRVPKDVTGASSVQVRLENNVVRPSGTLLLELLIIPSPYEFPQSLELMLGSDPANEGEHPTLSKKIELVKGEPLTQTWLMPITLEIPKDQANDAILTIPYRLSGTTTHGGKIEERGRWLIENKPGPTEPISYKELQQCWPGAAGDPIDSKSHAFHGRHDEKKQISTLLMGQDGRQRSALIFGPRRIGKTSLMREMLLEYPPGLGRVCGVYINLGGIQKRRNDEPLTETLFHWITSIDGDPGGYNRLLSEQMREVVSYSWCEQLQRGLDPSTSIATALTRFVERISNEIKNRVSRMAFFVDEFQAIFKFPDSEVEKLMWSLRPIVQQSTQISLILAGSGTMRDLVRGYDQAFHGSITQVQLSPFSLVNEREAIADTFLPRMIRERLSPSSRDFDALVNKAYELSGGHPWFLSMLGHASAKYLEGRPLSPALLNQVAYKMVRGSMPGLDREANASKFYAPLFDSLDSRPFIRSIIQLVITNIARQVTLEWPWVTVDQAITGPQIKESKITEKECLDAVRILRDEDILYSQRDAHGMPKYRIKIPLLAEAVKYDADEIEYAGLRGIKEQRGSNQP